MQKRHCDFCDKTINGKITANRLNRQHLQLHVLVTEGIGCQDLAPLDVCKECIGELFFSIPKTAPVANGAYSETEELAALNQFDLKQFKKKLHDLINTMAPLKNAVHAIGGSAFNHKTRKSSHYNRKTAQTRHHPTGAGLQLHSADSKRPEQYKP